MRGREIFLRKVVSVRNDQYKSLLLSSPPNLIRRKFGKFRRLWKHWNFFGNINMFLTYPQNIPMLCQIIAPQNSCLPNKTIHYSVISAAVTCTATPPHLNCPSVTGHRQSMLQNRNLGHFTKDNIMSTDTDIKKELSYVKTFAMSMFICWEGDICLIDFKNTRRSFWVTTSMQHINS